METRGRSRAPFWGGGTQKIFETADFCFSQAPEIFFKFPFLEEEDSKIFQIDDFFAWKMQIYHNLFPLRGGGGNSPSLPWIHHWWKPFTRSKTKIAKKYQYNRETITRINIWKPIITDNPIMVLVSIYVPTYIIQYYQSWRACQTLKI